MKTLVLDDQFDSIYNTIRALANAGPSQHDLGTIYFARNDKFAISDRKCMPEANRWDTELDTEEQIGAFLKTIDILVLDLQLETAPEHVCSNDALTLNFADISSGGTTSFKENERKAINGKFGGIAFYHRFRKYLKHCQAVLVFTGDQTGTTGAEKWQLVSRYIDPFCGSVEARPYTAKYLKGSKESPVLYDRISTLAKLHRRGFVDFSDLYSIEFAAQHDEPVLLVGESGTGKEFVAQAIHERWAQERRRNANTIARLGFATINCAQLSDTLTDSQLFGALHGSYTGPLDHILGTILKQGVGISLGGRREANRVAEEDLIQRSTAFARSLRRGEDGNLLIVGEGVNPDDDGVNTTPLGTLFLDEFGDIPLSAQAKLLRYLQDWEVAMVGLAGVVKGARLRIIAATSDPRFAAFAGFAEGKDALRGQWRSPEEMARPLRADLLFRVKGQAIRVAPVTEDNVQGIVDRMLNGRSVDWWPDQNRTRLITILKRQIEAVKNTDNPLRPIFGHRREIARLIKLAEAYLASAALRGVPAKKPNVLSKGDFEFLYKPSSLLVPESGSRAERRSTPFETVNSAAIRSQVERIVSDGGGILRKAWSRSHLSTFYKECTDNVASSIDEALSFDGPPPYAEQIRSVVFALFGKSSDSWTDQECKKKFQDAREALKKTRKKIQNKTARG